MSAREKVLQQVRAALRDVSAHGPADAAPVARAYRLRDNVPAAELLHQFAERVAEYKAQVQLVSEAALPEAITAALGAHATAHLAIPADIPAAWLPPSIIAIRDHGQRTYQEIDACDGVLTGCALGIAQTGTIVLDHGPLQGRRALSLLPDYHLCVVWAQQIVGLLPEAIARLAEAGATRRPLTWISGPSATSDIELNRVEGVHGPRTLQVLIVSDATPTA